MTLSAVIFDTDGVLIDSEVAWNEARRELVQERGGSWRGEAQRVMMGMSSREWSHYMREELGVRMSEDEISAAIVARLEDLYRTRLPLIAPRARGCRRARGSLAARDRPPRRIAV